MIPTIYQLEQRRPLWLSRHADYIMDNLRVSDTCRALFTGDDVVRRLRDSSGLRSSSTPSDATWKEYRQYTHSCWGTAPEAVALTLYYMASEQGVSGKEIDRLRDAVEYVWDSLAERPGQSWHQDRDGEWEGNPATAPVVFRAVNLAYDVHYQRTLDAAKSTSATTPQA
ncbi:unnamed protein product [Peniophora sp. CBMAI 1063]|nr:unnamed protein product [Peniophora sp. CBMAI 1063]